MISEVDAVAAWNALLARVTDLAVEGFYVERRVQQSVSPSSVGVRAMMIEEQLSKANALRADLTAFLKARVEAAKGVRK